MMTAPHGLELKFDKVNIEFKTSSMEILSPSEEMEHLRTMMDASVKAACLEGSRGSTTLAVYKYMIHYVD